MAAADSDLRAYGFVEEGVALAEWLHCSRSQSEFALCARAPPPLVVNVASQRDRSDVEIALLLVAVARAQERSRELRSCPSRKAAFWAAIFPRSDQLDDGIERWVMEDPAFPHVALRFRQMSITRRLLNLLLAFMTSPPSDCTGDARLLLSAPSRPAISLDFTQIKVFGFETMRLLLEFFDALFAHPTRRFAIRALDLSGNTMMLAELEMLTELLEKSQRVYRIEDISLNSIHQSWARESDSANQFSSLLGVLFKPLSPVLALTRLALDYNGLELQHFAIMCSALRYGGCVAELSLVRSLSGVSVDDKRQCWRWLAFALFYPRSVLFGASASRLQKINLSRIELLLADAEAIRDMLRDPAAELVYNGSRPAGQSPELVGVCRVLQGAKIYESASITSRCNVVLESELELETLVRDDGNGWTCIVFPGVGLGWVYASHVKARNSEGSRPHEVDRAPPLYDLTLGSDARDERPVAVLLASIGPHLSSLSLQGSKVDMCVLQSHCVNLKHLNLENCLIPIAQCNFVSALLTQARNQPSCFSRLESLNLNDTDLGDQDVDRLVEALSTSDPSKPAVALTELHIFSGLLTSNGYERIHGLLMANKTLRVVEMVDPRRFLQGEELFRRFEECHQGKLLRVHLAFRGKLAFLSVLTARDETERPHARASLDTNLVATIFSFAGTALVRRILWRQPHNYDNYDY